MENKTGNFEVHTMNELMGREINSNDKKNIQGIEFLNKKPISSSLSNIGVEIPNEESSKFSKSKKSSLKMIIFLITIVIFVVLGSLGYLYKDKLQFLSFLNKEEIKTENNDELINNLNGFQGNVNDSEEDLKNDDLTENNTYSSDLSNYFSIDIENENVSQDIQKELELIRKSLPEQNFSKPISFIVVDKNSKSVSFKNFIRYSNIEVSDSILDNLGDKFELYAYHDYSAGVRFGFRVDVLNKVALEKYLVENEKSLPKDVSFLFEKLLVDLNNLNDFNTSEYNNHEIRYLNLNKNKTYSVDYILNEDNFILGTSKKTMRAILDKLDENEKINSESQSTTIEDWIKINSPYNFLGMNIYYPSKGKVSDVEEKSDLSEIYIYLDREDVNPNIIIKDYFLSGCPSAKTTCLANETIEFTTKEKYSELENKFSNIMINRDLNAKFTCFKKDSNTNICLINSDKSVVELDFLNQSNEFINDFLNKIEL